MIGREEKMVWVRHNGDDKISKAMITTSGGFKKFVPSQGAEQGNDWGGSYEEDRWGE
jgi:hypothetical protein